MGLFRKNRPQTFDAWFDDATRGFCDFAKGQVREEYEDHFTAAYEDLRAEGLDEQEAQESAVQSLGTARKIRRQLIKVYLTRGEDKRLGRIAASRVRIERERGKGLLEWFAKAAAFVVYGGFFAALVELNLSKRWGTMGTILGLGAAVATLIIARRGISASSLTLKLKNALRATSLENVLVLSAHRSLLQAFFFAWLATYLLNGNFLDHLFPAIVLLVSSAAGFLDGARGFVAYQSIARKLRLYPAQNGTANVLELRNRIPRAPDSPEPD